MAATESQLEKTHNRDFKYVKRHRQLNKIKKVMGYMKEGFNKKVDTSKKTHFEMLEMKTTVHQIKKTSGKSHLQS